MTVDQMIERLTSLHKDIWQERHQSSPPYRWTTEKRPLTDDEWQLVFDCAKRDDVAVHLHNACMGFGVGMALIYVAPTMAVITATLIDVTNNHIGPEKRFADGWSLFYPLADTDRNKALLKHAELPELREMSYYDY
jgi:hypothetical protein